MRLLTPCGFAWDPTRFPRLYSIDPYLGCPFGCTYCWSEAMAKRFKRLPPGGWRDVQPRSFVDITSNLYHKALTLPQPSTILVGATCDPYPPLEKTETHTACILYDLQTANLVRVKLGRHPHKILVLTKSPIVCRDWELLKALDAQVGLTLTAPAGVDTRFWEPYAFSNASRIAALKFLHRQGVKTFASIEPWLIRERDGRGMTFKERWAIGYLGWEGVEFWDISQPWRIIEEARPWVDYFIVGSHNRAGRPIPALIPYYKEALPGVLVALKASGREFWIKPELKEVLND